MEQIQNALPFPFSEGYSGEAGRLNERDRTATFSSLISTDMSWFLILLAAYNFVKAHQESPPPIPHLPPARPG